MELYIYGAGGHGRVALHAAKSLNVKVRGFIDDSLKGEAWGVPVYALESVEPALDVFVHIAVGDNRVRQRLQAEWCSRGGMAHSIIHPASFLYAEIAIGSGSLVLPNALIGPGVTMGAGCIVNHGAIVDHDTAIGSFCHIAPGSIIGGEARMGNFCLIGSGAIVQPGVTIGDNAIVGSGAVVTANVESGSVVVGSPARSIDRRIS